MGLIIMSIDSLAIKQSKQSYNEGFLNFLEDYIGMIKQGGLEPLVVPSAQASSFPGDLYGLLLDLGISPDHHYAVMRVNGLRSPNDFDGLEKPLLIPDLRIVDQLKSLYYS